MRQKRKIAHIDFHSLRVPRAPKLDLHCCWPDDPVDHRPRSTLAPRQSTPLLPTAPAAADAATCAVADLPVALHRRIPSRRTSDERRQKAHLHHHLMVSQSSGLVDMINHRCPLSHESRLCSVNPARQATRDRQDLTTHVLPEHIYNLINAYLMLARMHARRLRAARFSLHPHPFSPTNHMLRATVRVQDVALTLVLHDHWCCGREREDNKEIHVL